MITCKWLLPSFQLKYDQTKTKRRTPLWFKKMLNEWVTSNHKENQESEVKYDIHKWICSCKEYLNSTFFLCRHLVKSTTIELRFYTDIIVRDNYPFILLADNIRSESADNIEDHITAPRIAYTSEKTSIDVNVFPEYSESSDECDESYTRISQLLQFLNKHVEEEKHNKKQLQILDDQLKDMYIYQTNVNDFSRLRKLPKTWSKDLNKYTMFL
jgi:hypothetical protein